MGKQLKINVFDFDGTLFKSPMINPQFWDKKFLGYALDLPNQGGLGWFQNIKSLSPPYVPEDPEVEKWFNPSVVKEVLNSMSDPDSVTVLLTGRTIPFLERVQRVTSHVGLKFDYYGLKPVEYNNKKALAQDDNYRKFTTMGFKKNYIVEIFRKEMEKIKEKGETVDSITIKMWDDRPKHVAGFSAYFEEKQYLQDHQWLEAVKISSQVFTVTEGNTYFDRELDRKLVDDLALDLPEKIRPKIILSSHSALIAPDQQLLIQEWFMKTCKDRILKKIEIPDLLDQLSFSCSRLSFSPYQQKKIEKLDQVALECSTTSVGVSPFVIGLKAKLKQPSCSGIITVYRKGYASATHADEMQWIDLEPAEQLKFRVTIVTLYTRELPTRTVREVKKTERLDCGALVRFVFPTEKKEISNIKKEVEKYMKDNNISPSQESKEQMLQYIRGSLIYRDQKLNIGKLLNERYGSQLKENITLLYSLVDWILTMLQSEGFSNCSLHEEWLADVLSKLNVSNVLSHVSSPKELATQLSTNKKRLTQKKLNIGALLRHNQPWLLQKESVTVMNHLSNIVDWMNEYGLNDCEWNEFFVVHYIKNFHHEKKFSQKPQPNQNRGRNQPQSRENASKEKNKKETQQKEGKQERDLTKEGKQESDLTKEGKQESDFKGQKEETKIVEEID